MEQYTITQTLENEILQLQQTIQTTMSNNTSRQTSDYIDNIVKLCEISVRENRLDIFDFIYKINYSPLLPTIRSLFCGVFDYKDSLNFPCDTYNFPKQLYKYISSKRFIVNMLLSFYTTTSDIDIILTRMYTIVKNDDDMQEIMTHHIKYISAQNIKSQNLQIRIYCQHLVTLNVRGNNDSFVKRIKIFLDTTKLKFKLDYEKSHEYINMMYFVNYFDSITNKDNIDNIVSYFLQKINKCSSYNICFAYIMLKLKCNITDELIIQLFSYCNNMYYDNMERNIKFRNEILMEYYDTNNYTETQTKKLVSSIAICSNNLFVENMLKRYPSIIDQSLFNKLIESSNYDAMKFCITNKYFITPIQINTIICHGKEFDMIKFLVNFYGLYDDKSYLKKILSNGNVYPDDTQKYINLFEGSLERTDIIECIIMAIPPTFTSAKKISNLCDSIDMPYFSKTMINHIFCKNCCSGPDALYNIIYNLKSVDLSYFRFVELMELCKKHKYTIQYDDLVGYIVNNKAIIIMLAEFPEICSRS